MAKFRVAKWRQAPGGDWKAEQRTGTYVTLAAAREAASKAAGHDLKWEEVVTPAGNVSAYKADDGWSIAVKH